MECGEERWRAGWRETEDALFFVPTLRSHDQIQSPILEIVAKRLSINREVVEGKPHKFASETLGMAKFSVRIGPGPVADFFLRWQGQS